MEHLLTEEQRAIRDLARTIAEEKVKPVRAKYDEEGIFPWDIVRELAKVDLFRVFIPAAYDGLVESGHGITNMCLVTEELSKACAGIALAFAGTALGAFPILLFGTEEQKQKYLPRHRGGEEARRLRPHRADGGLRRGRACAPPRGATATTTSSTAPSSGSPTAARRTSTPRSR